MGVETEAQLFAQVIVNVPASNLDKTFEYQVPASLQSQIHIGSRVIVPFGPRRVQGYVLDLSSTAQFQAKLKAIEKVLDPYPPLTEELLQLGQWMKDKYICLHTQAIEAMLPAVFKGKTKQVKATHNQQVQYEVVDGITVQRQRVIRLSHALSKEEALELIGARAKKQQQLYAYLYDLGPDCETPFPSLVEQGYSASSIQGLVDKDLIHITERELERNPYLHLEQAASNEQQFAFTQDQQQVFDHIQEAIASEQYQAFLLHGVTGSGKTEIYLETIATVLREEHEAIMLVPEIALTPQMVKRFKGRFGAQVAVLHSRLSSGERYDEWRKIREGRVKVVVGARSALFAPFQKLGVIIIDEEHEGSYKQEETPRYHARDIALFRAQYYNIPVIFGSATPSLESYARATKNVFQLIELPQRVHGQQMPEVQIVDMRQELHAGNRSMFSRSLIERMEGCLARGEQMVLFLNRRGYSTFVMCRDCGYVLQCPHCDISLTYHKHHQQCRCHYCGYQEPLPQACPACESKHIRFFGTGTQKVEEELSKLFPSMRIIRMDVDTTQQKGAHERLLDRFRQQGDCLLGTQMIAKGLDFERVTLVGVLAADSLLHLPDFRAAEKTFQLITQVSGRAGRHQLPGHVIVQSYTPEHYSILHAAKHDYASFYLEEMQQRRKRAYPPYTFLTLLTFSHEDLPYLIGVADRSVEWIRQQLTRDTEILGPVASPIPRIKDRYRYQCLIKYRNEHNLEAILSQLQLNLEEERQKQQLRLQIDVNPQMMM